MKTDSRCRWVAVVLSVGLIQLAGDSLHAEQPNNGEPQSAELPSLPVQFDSPDSLRTPANLRFEQPFQSGNKCGVNALYAVLYLVGEHVEYDTVLERLPVGARGSNLQDICDAAREFGLDCEIRKAVPPEVLKWAAKPVIVHLHAHGATQHDSNNNGHFLVVCGYHPNRGFIGIDTTNCSLTILSERFLARNMSGYCLFFRGALAKGLWMARLYRLSLGFAVAAWGGLACVIVLRAWKKWTKQRGDVPR